MIEKFKHIFCQQGRLHSVQGRFMPKPFFQHFSAPGLVCAHRGARSIAPENTSLAMVKARTCGAELWETDVQLTTDGVAVLFHDDTLVRTTDILAREALRSKAGLRLTEFSWGELADLDAGSWFIHSDPYGTIQSGEVAREDLLQIAHQRILRLDEALGYCRQHDFPVNLELKDQRGTAADVRIVATVLELLRQTDTEELVLISSFNHDYLRQVRQQSPNLATAALVEGAHPPEVVNYLRALGCDAYHPDQRLIDADFVRQLSASGMPVNPWTVNDEAQALELLAAGAFFICTDWPQRLLKARHSA